MRNTVLVSTLLALAPALGLSITALAAPAEPGPPGVETTRSARDGMLPRSGRALSGSLSISSAGGWSTSNFGKQLLITTPQGASNPALGFTDSQGGNLWSLADQGHTFTLNKMPAYSNSTEPPIPIVTFSDGRGNNIAGMEVNLSLSAQPPAARWAGTLTSMVRTNYRLASPGSISQVLSVYIDDGDTAHNGTHITGSAGEFDAFLNATDDNSGNGTPGSAFGFGTHQTCIKHNPPGGLPRGGALKNCEVEWNLMYGPNNQYASMNGVEVLQEHDYNVNGLDDVGNRPAQELIFGTKTAVSSGGWPAFITTGYLVSGEGADVSAGNVYLGDYFLIGSNISNSALDLQQVSSYAPKITSPTPGSPTYSVTVDNVLPLGAGTISYGTIGVGGGSIADTAAKTKTTTARTTRSLTVPLSSTYYLRTGMFVYDMTTPANMPSGAYIASISGLDITLNKGHAASVGNGDTLLFAEGQKQVTIKGVAYTVAGVIVTAAGSSAGTVYFATPVSVADATTGASIVPNAHAIWLCQGSSAAPWCDVAFSRDGKANVVGDGRDGIVLNATKVSVHGGMLELQGYTVATLPTCSAVNRGSLAYVTDAASPKYNGRLTGGGSAVIPAFCNGAAWTAH